MKTFPTLIEALPTLEDLGISMKVSERERMEQELTRETWQRQENRRRKGEVSEMLPDLYCLLYVLNHQLNSLEETIK